MGIGLGILFLLGLVAIGFACLKCPTNMHMPRKLTEADIGHVFRRVDAAAEDKYLLLHSIHDRIASFITFQLDDGSLHDVADMGYFNGKWYVRSENISPKAIAQVKHDYDAFVAKRLEELTTDAAKIEQRDIERRNQYNKPSAWEFMGTQKCDDSPATECVVWYCTDSTLYVVEAYNGSRLLAHRQHSAAAEPRFGMDVRDADAIYGTDGVIRSLLASLDENGG